MDISLPIYHILSTVFLFALLIGLVIPIIWINQLKKAETTETDNMTDQEFVSWIKGLFGRMDYTIKVTPASKEKGANLIVTDIDGIKTALLVKNLAQGKVETKIINAALRGKKYYQCDKVIIVTNQSFTNQTIKEAQKNSIELWDSSKLLEIIKHIEYLEKKLMAG